MSTPIQRDKKKRKTPPPNDNISAYISTNYNKLNYNT